MNSVYTQGRLDQLLNERVHGATNIAGIRFQLLYSVRRAFDLYGPDAPDAIQLEAIEDLDVRGHKQWEIKKLKISNQFVQVKTSKAPWEWGRFASSGIVQNFLPVWDADAKSELLVVTNFSYKAGLDEFAKFCSGVRGSLSSKVKSKLKELCTNAGYLKVDPLQLAKRIRFVQISEKELLAQIEPHIVRHFNLTAPNAELYLSALMGRFLVWAEQRKEVRRQDVENFRLSMQEQIDLGVQNVAVKNGWLGRLAFTPDAHAEDYYEGKNARPGHILAGMDVVRPEWMEHIQEVLERSSVCVVRASSGQGKSTLLYRYAHEHYNPETTFIVRQLTDETMLGSIIQALKAWQGLGLPLLVLIDNVGSQLKYWSQLAGEFSGQAVRFLVSVREEDWFRYAGNLSGFNWEIVAPTLSLVEARGIYDSFKGKGKIAANVSSAEWAYEKIAESKLLIEFTYLLTHGHMLEERLRQQVQAIDQLREDPAKLMVLRLVSVAQIYGARITYDALMQCVAFTRDPGITLQSLIGEYLIVHEGMFEGLHYVRSQHLVELLHQVIPLEKTAGILVQHLDPENLELFLGTVFTDVAVNSDQLLPVLVDRCLREPLEFTNRMVMSLFTASELTYYRLHKPVFDEAFAEVGNATFMLLCSETLPFSKDIHLIQSLQEIAGEALPRVTALAKYRDRFAPRHWEDRVEIKLLRALIEGIDRSIIDEELTPIGGFLDWCRLPGVEPSRVVAFLAEHDWRDQLYQADLKAAAALLNALSHHVPEAYQALLVTDKGALMNYFKLASETLRITEQGEEVGIEFIVSDEQHPNEQAVDRLRNLRKFFPTYQRYCSDGLFPSSFGTEMKFPTDATKRMTRETLEQEIDAEKNGAYFRAVKVEYAAESMFDWQKQWFDIRSELLQIIRECLNLYEALFRQQPFNWERLADRMNTALDRLSHLRELPTSFSERFQKEQHDLLEWSSNVSNFIEQFAGHDPKDAHHRLSHLMKYNLRESVKHLGKAQKALHTVMDDMEKYVSVAELDEGEVRDYDALSSVIDFWFERPSGRVPIILKAAMAHRQHKEAQFVEAVRTTLQPLEAEGFRFTYPTRPLEDHPLIAICLGFEMESYAAQPVQLTRMVAQLAAFPLEYHFLYVTPLVKGRLINPTVMKISRDTILGSSGENRMAKQLPIIPVEPPQEFFEILPVGCYALLKEMELRGEFHGLYGKYNTLRNTLYFVKRELDPSQPFEHQLAEKYQRRIEKELKGLADQKQQWTQKAIQHEEGNLAASQWKQFYELCLNRFQVFDLLEDLDAEQFQPVNILNDIELITAFNTYMDAVNGSSI